MSLNVTVSGLPGNAVFKKLLFPFKSLLKKINISEFWIRELSSMYGENYKQMTVEFSNNADARKARNFFNNFPFTYGKMEYYLQAEMCNDSVQPEMDRGRRRRPAKRERPRSRSPGYNREASKLDMEIELLRKQRQVIEEERRLLLEQKKLEMIREYGPSASRDFEDYDAFEEYEDFEGFEPPRKRRHPESVPSKQKKPRDSSPPPLKPSKRSQGLPLFYQPCRKLIAQMRPYIDKDTNQEEREILVKLIRAAIRKNLAIALEAKEYMPTREILIFYREQHPKEKDEAFVAKILANIRASFLTEFKDEAKVKKECAAEEVKDTKEVVETAGSVKDEVAPQETTVEEPNDTDTNTHPNAEIQVKTEPNVSQELEDVSTGNLSVEVPEIKTNDSDLNNTLPLDEKAAEDKLLEDVVGEAGLPDDVGDVEGETVQTDWVTEQ